MSREPEPRTFASTAAIPMLSVTMPVYNEETTVREVVLEHVGVLERLKDVVADWEIVCVDDGSKDRSPEILEELAMEVPRVRFIQQANRGIFGAFTRAYRESRGSHIFVTASDGQWPAANLEALIPALVSGAQVVVGVRQNRGDVYSPLRRVISTLFNYLPQIFFRVRLQDAGGTKVAIRKIFDYDLISTSPFFEAERLIRAHREGCRIVFVPIQFLPRSGGKGTGVSWKNVSRSSLDLVRCVFRYSFR